MTNVPIKRHQGLPTLPKVEQGERPMFGRVWEGYNMVASNKTKQIPNLLTVLSHLVLGTLVLSPLNITLVI